MTNALVKTEEARRAIAEARRVDEVKDIHDKAEAIRMYAKQAGMSLEIVNDAAEVKIRAERKGGELLASVERSNGGHPINNSYQPDTSYKQTIQDAGLSDMTAHRWQVIASLPEERFEQFIAETKSEKQELTTAAVLREAKRVEHEAARGSDGEPPAPPMGKYSTIVIDPPWPIQKIEREVRPMQVGLDYATMTIDELKFFPVASFSAEAAHCYLWTTQRFLPDAFTLMSYWGFQYIFTMVWHKPGGYQPFGLAQYNCEFVLFGRKGSLPFLDTKNFPACFEAPRREHSRKPDEFYDLVRRVSPQPRIDVFSREPRMGFSQFGNEVEKFNG